MPSIWGHLVLGRKSLNLENRMSWESESALPLLCVMQLKNGSVGSEQAPLPAFEPGMMKDILTAYVGKSLTTRQEF